MTGFIGCDVENWSVLLDNAFRIGFMREKACCAHEFECSLLFAGDMSANQQHHHAHRKHTNPIVEIPEHNAKT